MIRNGERKGERKIDGKLADTLTQRDPSPWSFFKRLNRNRNQLDNPLARLWTLCNTVVADVVLVIMDQMVAERMLAWIVVRAKFRRAVRSLSRVPRRGNDALPNLLWPLYLLHCQRRGVIFEMFFEIYTHWIDKYFTRIYISRRYF